MTANYTEVSKVSKLETSFQQVPVVQIFWNFHNIVVKIPIITHLRRKVKNIRFNSEIAQFRPILAVNLILG